MVKIKGVNTGSISDSAGIKAGDFLLRINDKKINDVLDYEFYLADKNIVLSIKREENEIQFDIKKKTYEDIGLEFETPLMDKKQRCENKCIFCFIDQLPKGLRESLYFKDDDSRLSFLHGNYITMTNLHTEDIERIIEMHISPVNISVHTTNPDLRCKIMHNKRAGEVLSYMQMLAEGGIMMSCQIVLCRDINDGEELEKTLHDLAKFNPRLNSVAIVPSGLTSFRQSLYPLKPFDKESCRKVIKQVEKINAHYRSKFGKNLFFCSDEFYLIAELPLPNDDYYEDYSQIENGVGMLRSFETEAHIFLKSITKEEQSSVRNISIATGDASYDFINSIVNSVKKKCKNINCRVFRIENDFFGHSITVSGLITGKDLYNQLKNEDLGEELLITRNMLRQEGDLFLCGTSLEELQKMLNVKITPTENDGASFVENILGIKEKQDV